MAHGAGHKQIIVEPAGLPGAANAIFSAKQNITVTTGNATGATVITDIGVIHFMPTPASVSVQMQESAGTWTAILPASTTAGLTWMSDGTNLRFSSADTSTNRTGSYYLTN